MIIILKLSRQPKLQHIQQNILVGIKQIFVGCHQPEPEDKNRGGVVVDGEGVGQAIIIIILKKLVAAIK